VSEKVKLISEVQPRTSKHVLWKASQLLWSRELHILFTFLVRVSWKDGVSRPWFWWSWWLAW